MKYKKSDMTAWFDYEVKPVRPGVYEVGYFGDEFAYFDGARWGWSFATKREANRDRDTHGAAQNKVWRGLNKEPV